MAKAPSEQREYFARVARKARDLDDSTPPRDLEEMFDRLEEIRSAHGALAQPGMKDDEGDLPSHLAFLRHLNALRRRGKIRSQ